MNTHNINHVHLIGKIASEPQLSNANGANKGSFSIATKENYINANGELKSLTNWHKILVTGRNAMILKHFAVKGTQLALEGKLISRFFQNKDGQKQFITEIHANDLVIL
jgi:single-strand DNA-binding protein